MIPSCQKARLHVQYPRHIGGRKSPPPANRTNSKASGSVLNCLHSWTYWHNESVNIHSHVVGALLFLYLPVYVFTPERWAVATRGDVVVCYTYFLSVAVCFVLSAA